MVVVVQEIMHLCLNAHRNTASGSYRFNMWVRLECDRLCVCELLMASPDVASFPEAPLLVRCERSGVGAHGVGLPAPPDVHITAERSRSRPRLSGKTHAGLFPAKNKAAHAARGLLPRGRETGD